MGTETGPEGQEEMVKRGEIPSWMKQTGWVTYKGGAGQGEQAQAFLHGHFPDEWGGSGPEHEDCKPLYEIIDNIELDIDGLPRELR